MTDPSTPLIATIVAGLSSVTLGLLGVDYYALMGACVGVLLMMGNLKAVTVPKMVGIVIVSILVSAILGQGVADLTKLNTRPAVMLFSLLFGVAGQVGVQAVVDALLARIKSVGGGSQP